VTLHIQFVTLFMMFGSGLVLGTLFDTCRVLFAKLKPPRWLLPFVDMFYWSIATVLVFYMLMVSNEGQVRVFVFLGIGIGICFYFALLSDGVIWILLLLIRFLIASYRFAKKMVELFLIRPVLGIYRLTVILFGFLIAIAVFLFKIVVQLIYPVWRLLLWAVHPLSKIQFWPRELGKWPKKVLELLRKLF
jgi:spore cortex biosynthesis protein YabQ